MALDPGSTGDWLHALRNATNALGISLKIAEDAFDNDDCERAQRFLQRAIRAQDECQRLLRDVPWLPGRDD